MTRLPAAVLPALAAAILIPALPCCAAVEVDCAYLHVDVGGQYEWSEGAAGLADFGKQDHRAGTIKVYLHNTGEAAAMVDASALDGVPLARLREDEKHSVIWWRTWPNPIQPGGYAEVSVRLRYPVTADPVLTLESGGETMQVTISATPPPFRIETVAWDMGGRRATVVAQKLREEPAQITKVFLDGVDVTAQSRIPAPEFFQGISPVVIELPDGLGTGSFHTYKIVSTDGEAAACTLRTLDDYLRLGMYGASDLEADVKLGLNTATHFRAQSRATLDRYAAYGLRTAFHISGAPTPEWIGHPAVHAYLVHDEPDCWDYSAEEWPAPMRIGYHAPDIVEHVRLCAEADPVTPVMCTVDLTFKPANYYVYGQIADIISPDCYPLTIGQPLTWVRDVAEVCRSAVGPRRMDFVPQVDFEDRQNTEMKFRRPPFGREVVIQYLYALGAGARGFSGWEWFDEKADWCHFYGALNYPDVLNAVASVYRRFALVSPLIMRAHPTDIGTCEAGNVWLKTLVCGDDALLLVAVNEDYESLPKDFAHNARQNVEITLPRIPWLKTGYAALVGDGELKPVALAADDDGARITLPNLDTGEIILVSADESLGAQLLARHTDAQRDAGAALLRGVRQGQAAGAEEASVKRYIEGRMAEYAVPVSRALSAYGVEDGGFINPAGEKYPGIEWWTEATPRGGEWTVSIPAERAGRGHTVYFQMSRWGGGYLRVEVEGADGKLVLERDRPAWDGPVPNFGVTFAEEGEYKLRILQLGEGKIGGRLARSIFVAPDDALPPAGLPW